MACRTIGAGRTFLVVPPPPLILPLLLLVEDDPPPPSLPPPPSPELSSWLSVAIFFHATSNTAIHGLPLSVTPAKIVDLVDFLTVDDWSHLSSLDFKSNPVESTILSAVKRVGPSVEKFPTSETSNDTSF